MMAAPARIVVEKKNSPSILIIVFIVSMLLGFGATYWKVTSYVKYTNIAITNQQDIDVLNDRFKELGNINSKLQEFNRKYDILNEFYKDIPSLSKRLNALEEKQAGSASTHARIAQIGARLELLDNRFQILDTKAKDTRTQALINKDHITNLNRCQKCHTKCRN